jgi:plastocyanin
MSGPLLDQFPSPQSRSIARGAVALAVVLCLSLVAAACGGDDDGAAAPTDVAAELPDVPESDYEDLTGQASVVIEARDNTFVPQYAVVSPGTEITFENRGRNPHNVIAVEAGAFVDIPTEDLQPGDSPSMVMEDPGDFPYYCSLHATPSRGMIGRIRVAEE